MKQSTIRAVLTGLLFATGTAVATDEIYINDSNADYSLTSAPQIDARAFVNNGNFVVLTAPLLFDTQNTLYVTNNGTMSGSVGFQFDLATSLGARKSAAQFVNLRRGVIEALEYYYVYASNTMYFPTFITVSATNIVNEGLLRVGNSGLLRLEGKNIDLTRGGLEVGTLEPSILAGPVAPEGNFIADSGIYDLWWGTGIMPPDEYSPAQNSSAIVRMVGNSFLATSPLHTVADRYGAGYMRVATLTTTPSAYTNIVDGVWTTLTNANGTFTNVFLPTNVMNQLVFVGVSDTNNFAVRTKYFPSTRANVEFNTVAVEIRMANTNVVASTGDTNAIYFIDRLASETNLILWTNVTIDPGEVPPTYKPQAHEVWRTAPLEFLFGFNGNVAVDSTMRNLVYNQSYSNVFVTNYYAGYSAYVDYLQVRPPVVPRMGATEQPGRIEVVGDNVNLTKARFQGMGLISVQAKHLISSSNAVVDAPELVYSLGSTNGLLTVQNLARQSTLRMGGNLEAWSGLWTNQMALVLSNWYIDATTNYFSPITNPVDVGIHVLILSADFLNATQQVVIHDFVTSSTNTVVNDPLYLPGKLQIFGESFTLGSSGTMTLTNPLSNWSATNSPGLRYFTNQGVITVENRANYGSDTAQPYKGFVNAGTLNAYTHNIAAESYENRGSINSSNVLSVRAGAVKLENGRDFTRGAETYRAWDLKLRNYTILADGGLALDITNSLSDAGAGSPNSITVLDGFHLLRKPATGDLLGTVIETSAPQFASVTHTWAAEDRGASRDGYTNNAALGRLVLGVSPGGELRFIKPADTLGNPLPGNYALYVDYLELESTIQADPESAIVIDPGMTVYFAGSNMAVEELDGLCGGRLRWVRDYAGTDNTVPVASYMGPTYVTTIYVNKALLNSAEIDSDGDGIPNLGDNWPFDGVRIADVEVMSLVPLTLQLSWTAAAETTYRVEYSSSLLPAAWQPLVTITNPAATAETLTVTDTVPAGSADRERYYRVRYDP
ncbi:MAG TPA: hypothetical protein PKM73_20810 [Verrucomicrobiota bacterium]|nr:hypothetical protein [Verrucomicrobiota bacterium]HNU50063.1 hypothetical protein [Verrucomicrobiota bacterium]